MSWKASAFVKEITHNINIQEKFVLLLLADYHNTARRTAWPSVRRLAEEALMMERSAYRVLARLEKKGFIQRISVEGKPNEYVILGLDSTPDNRSGVPSGSPDTIGSVLNSITPDRTPDRTPDPGGNAIRKERVEPVIEPVKTRPTSLPDWVPPEKWAAFVEMRQRIRKPLTDYAAELAIKKLNSLRADGHDPGKVLDHCIMNSYQGIFAPPDSSPSNGKRRQHIQQVLEDREETHAILRRREEARNQQGTMDLRPVAEDVSGDEQAQSQPGGPGDDDGRPRIRII